MTPEELQELAELEELEKLETQFAEVDTSPFPYKKQPLMMRGALQVADDITPKAVKAKAAQGINVDARLPAKESFIQSLTTNADERKAYVASYLKSAFPDAPLREGDDGELEYLDPQTKRWTVATPGALSAVGEMPEAIFSTLGALGGGTLGAAGGPAGVVGGGALGTTLGQLAGDVTRQKMGQLFGVNQSQTLGSMGSEALPEAVGAGALDLGVAGVYGAGRGIKFWLLGRQPLKPNEAAELLASQKHADKLVNDINKEVGGLFHPSTARKGSTFHSEAGEKMLTAEAQARTSPYVGPNILKTEQQNERALDMYFDNVTLGQRMQGVDSPSEGGQPLRQALDDESFNATRKLSADKSNAEDLSKAGMTQLPSGNKASAGRAIRGALNERYMVAKKATDEAYGAYKTTIGEASNKPSSIAVPWSRDVKSLQKTFKQAIARSPRQRSKDARAGLMLDTKGEVNLSDLDDVIKDLRDDIRRGMQGKLDVPLNLRDAKRLEKSLTNMRDTYLEKAEPEAFQALMNAEKAQFDESNLFRHGLTKNLLVKESAGRFKLSDSAVIARILKNEDAAAAKEIADIVKSNPDAMVEAQNFLFALYRRNVDPKQAMVPDFKRHKAFMNKYGGIVKEFFTPEQAGKLDQLGGWAETIFENTKKVKALNNAWARDFKGKLRSFDAEDLVESVNSNRFSVDEVRKLTQYANAYGGDVTKAWKAGIAEDLRHRLFKGDHLDPSRLGELTSDFDKMKKLSVVFGPKYVKDLNTLNDAMKMITRLSRDVDKFPKSTLFTDIARAWYAPPLSQTGRVVTLGQNNRARSYMANIYRALSDPDYLSDMASRTERTMRLMQGLNVGTNVARSLEDLQSD